MKTSLRIQTIMSLGLWVLAAANLPAQTFPVTVQWTLQQQDFSTFNKGVYNDKVKSTKLTANDLLVLLARAYATNFPDGSGLVLVDYDHFRVQDSSGGIVITNVSDFLSYRDSYAETNFLYQGKENTNTATFSWLFTYRATIQFNDPSTNGTSFTFSGPMQERYSRSAADRNGQQTYQDALLLNGDGSGTDANGFFLLSGTLKTPTIKWLY